MCAATISALVRFPDGKPASGASVNLLNRNAYSSAAKNWKAITDSEGIYNFHNMDTGTLGNIYDINAKHVDKESARIWIGEATAKIKKDTTVVVNLRELYLEEYAALELGQGELNFLNNIEDGDVLIAVIIELASTLARNLSHASISLTSYIIEAMIRIKMTLNKNWDKDWDTYTLGQLLGEDKVQKLLGNKFLKRTQIFNQLRILAIHPKGADSIMHDARMGVDLMKSMLKTWFNDRGTEAELGNNTQED